jgi:hypothetical protein
LIQVENLFRLHILFVPNDENEYVDYVMIQLMVLYDEMYQYDQEVNQQYSNFFPKYIYFRFQLISQIFTLYSLDILSIFLYKF